MFRRSIFFVVAVLTFGIGVGISLLAPIFIGRSPQSVLTLHLQPVVSNVERKRTYQSLMHAYGRTGRYEACFGGFSSSDGMNFSSTNIYFDSPKLARRELQRRLKSALEIVSRESVLDDTSRVVGEQVLATFPPYNKEFTASAELITVKGSDFISIGSASLRNMNEYKKDHWR